VLPHRHAAWLVLEERLRDASAFCEEILVNAPDLSARLRPVAASLQKQAAALLEG
jgi:hypothetical protein